MRLYSKILIVFFALILFHCNSSDDTNSGGNGGGGQAQVEATYRITFSPNFTEMSHPTDYPNNASFIKMMVVAHNANTSVFRVGQTASAGLKAYAEDGDTSPLELELVSVGDANSANVQIGMDIGPTGSNFVDIVVTPSTTLISFISKLSPSPDWFVGFDSFNLVNPDNTLVESFETTLFGYDAGTDSGVTYTSPDSPSNEPVSQVSGDPFVHPQSGAIRRFGTFNVERTDSGDN